MTGSVSNTPYQITELSKIVLIGMFNYLTTGSGKRQFAVKNVPVIVYMFDSHLRISVFITNTVC